MAAITTTFPVFPFFFNRSQNIFMQGWHIKPFTHLSISSNLFIIAFKMQTFLGAGFHKADFIASKNLKINAASALTKILDLRWIYYTYILLPI